MNIWCSARFPNADMSLLAAGLGDRHRLLLSERQEASVLIPGAVDTLLDQADVAFGQPDPQQVIAVNRLRWVHLSSAGYTRYDRDDVRAALASRGAMLTTSSGVYAEPCAQHALALMMSVARQLPACLDEQRTTREWRALEHRARCRLLADQNVLLLGFGAIGKRLAELLQPFGVRVTAVRRSPSKSSDNFVTIVGEDQVDALLPDADHVVNVLPASASTTGFVSATRLARMKPSAVFYNIGRGTTVDQDALCKALTEYRIAAAYLDVTDPEPLPVDHPLWNLPNCYITPHSAGGHDTEFTRLVRHFLRNLDAFENGTELQDRIV